jgi:hypothetical protein
MHCICNLLAVSGLSFMNLELLLANLLHGLQNPSFLPCIYAILCIFWFELLASCFAFAVGLLWLILIQIKPRLSPHWLQVMRASFVARTLRELSLGSCRRNFLYRAWVGMLARVSGMGYQAGMKAPTDEDVVYYLPSCCLFDGLCHACVALLSL